MLDQSTIDKFLDAIKSNNETYDPALFFALRDGTAPWASRMHHVWRPIGSNNVWDVTEGGSTTRDYAIGVVFWPVFFLLVVLIWSSTLCCPPCRRSRLYSPHLMKYRIVFAVGFVASLVGVILSIYGAAQLQTGLNGLIERINSLGNLIETVSGIIIKIGNLGIGFTKTVKQIQGDCVAPMVDFLSKENTTDARNANARIQAAFNQENGIPFFVGQVEKVGKQLVGDSGMMNEWADNLQSIQAENFNVIVPVFSVMAAVYVALCVNFVLVWLARAGRVTKNAFIKCCFRFSDFCVTPLLILVMLLFAIIALTTFTVAVGLGDFCYPSGTYNIIRFAGLGKADLTPEMVLALAWVAKCKNWRQNPNLSNGESDNVSPFLESATKIGDLSKSVVNELGPVGNVFKHCTHGKFQKLCPKQIAECTTTFFGTAGKVPTWGKNMTDAVEEVYGLLGCHNLPKVYNMLMSRDVCDHFQRGFSYLGVGLALGFLILISLTARGAFASRTEAEEEEDAESGAVVKAEDLSGTDKESELTQL